MLPPSEMHQGVESRYVIDSLNPIRLTLNALVDVISDFDFFPNSGATLTDTFFL